MNNIDTDSIVLTADSDKSVANDIDFDSITFDKEAKTETLPKESFLSSQLGLGEKRPPFYVLGTGIMARVIYDLKNTNYHLTEDTQREGIVNSISKISGVPAQEIDKHYSPFRLLFDSLMSGPAGAGKDVSPHTTEELINATMNPLMIASAVADPFGTVAGLLAFSALDHILPTPQLEGATQDQQASINLMGMLGKGLLVGGMFHGASKVKSEWFPDLMEKFGYHKLKEAGIPDIIDVKPEQLVKLQGKEQLLLPAPENMGEGFLMLTKEEAAARMEANIDMIAERAAQGEPLDPWMKEPGLMEAARQRLRSPDWKGSINLDAVDKILPEQVKSDWKMDPNVERIYQERVKKQNELEKEMKDAYDAKLKAFRERHGEPNADEVKGLKQSARSRAQKEFVQEISQRGQSRQSSDKNFLNDLGVSPDVADNAIKNGLNVKVKAEKIINIAAKSEADFNHVSEILGSGETKQRGLSLGVEEKAIANKLTKGFGDLPEYRAVKFDEQAKLANELLGKDAELALKIAMGEEPPPEGVIPEAVFVAVENKAIREGDVKTIRDLATKSKLSTEATSMGQRIATLATRDAESPMGAIKEVLKEREKAAEKKLGKKTIETAKKEAVKEIKTEIKKTASTKENWASFIKSLEC